MENETPNEKNISEAVVVSETKNEPTEQQTALQTQAVPEIPEHVKEWLQTQTHFLIVPKTQLETALALIVEAKEERKTLLKIGYCIMGLFGFLDENGKPDQKIISGEESWIPGLLKSLGDVMVMLTAAKMGTENMKKRNIEKLKEKFGFVKDFLPLMQKYGAEQ
jgi:hypothetical protein